MKILFLFFIGCSFYISTFAQDKETFIEWNRDGNIKSVRYSSADDDVPKDAKVFFMKFFNKEISDDFVFDKSKETDYGMRYERYQQYYHGVIVDNGHYNFRFQDGRMKVAKGHFVNVTGINPIPTIKVNEAINLYASFLGIDKSDVIASYIDLMIKEFPFENAKNSEAALTYRVFLHTNRVEESYIGYIDAHTGKLLHKENAFVNYSTTGQFYTYYNRNANDTPKTGTTEYTSNKYYLRDNTRGHGIRTKIQYPQYQDPILPSDNDNIWTRMEFGSYNIALDVHWTMQNIFDVMGSVFNHYSYDGYNREINSIIDSSTNAGYSYYDIFYFGNASGSSVFGPYGSVDVIGHEYGHAILQKTSNLPTSVSGAIHEGLADIWGIILEKHITPGASYWKTGEQIMINGESCMRNFKNPSDATAHTQIASTYGWGVFNSTDTHIVGGLLPYWFYLLSSGGSGTNGLNNNYQLVPVGFSLAEQLFANTTLTTAYLEDCTTFQDVMYAFIDAADDMNNGFLAEQVRNAWYAVGLNSEPPHIYCISYSPGSATYHVYGNSNCTVNWSFTKTSGSMPSLVPNNSNYSCTVNTSSSYSGNLKATIFCGGQTVTYSIFISGTASPSSAVDDMLQIYPIDETRYQLSLCGNNTDGYIKVYEATSLQQKADEKLENGNYTLDTSSWKNGLYIVEVTIGNKKYARKLLKRSSI